LPQSAAIPARLLQISPANRQNPAAKGRQISSQQGATAQDGLPEETDHEERTPLAEIRRRPEAVKAAVTPIKPRAIAAR
jgi:hypothetical protein